MLTLLVAAHFSNLNFSPPSHFLYDFCWTGFLPASLAFLLLAPLSPEEMKKDSTRETVAALSVPFVIGSIGSMLGCAIAFFICFLGADNHARIMRGRKHVAFGRLLLNPKEAAVTAGCVCASYIGGSYNFFAAARIICAKFGDDGGMLGSLLGAGAADLLVMAVYYSMATALVSSNALKALFPGRLARETAEGESLATPTLFSAHVHQETNSGGGHFPVSCDGNCGIVQLV